MGIEQKFISKDYPEGEVIFAQGATGDYIFIIISGSVEIVKTNGETRQTVATLSSGDILGEMAVLTNEPRSATAVALEPTKVIMVQDRTLRLALLNNELPILKPLTRQLISRFKEADQRSNDCQKVVARLKAENKALKEQLMQYQLQEEN